MISKGYVIDRSFGADDRVAKRLLKFSFKLCRRLHGLAVLPQSCNNILYFFCQMTSCLSTAKINRPLETKRRTDQNNIVLRSVRSVMPGIFFTASLHFGFITSVVAINASGSGREKSRDVAT